MSRSESDPRRNSAYKPDAERRISATVSADDVDQILEDHELFQGWDLERAGKTRGTHSDTTKYKSGGHIPIVVKHTSAATPEKAAESVTREFAALETVWKLCGQDDLRASLPRPLIVLPEHGLLVTEMLPGVPLSRVLRGSINYLVAPFRIGNMRELARRIGDWLSQFHHATRQPALLHDPQSFELDVAQQLEGCRRRNLSAANVDEIFGVASKGSRSIAGRLLPAAARHGDFTPRNVLISSDHIAVMDFENFLERDTIYEDLGKFVAFLTLLKGRPGYSRTAITSLVGSFLDGYGASADRGLVDLFALKAAVRIFAHRGSRRVAKSLRFDTFYTMQLVQLGRDVGRSLDRAV
jgi:hypothetical protein